MIKVNSDLLDLTNDKEVLYITATDLCGKTVTATVTVSVTNIVSSFFLLYTFKIAFKKFSKFTEGKQIKSFKPTRNKTRFCNYADYT